MNVTVSTGELGPHLAHDLSALLHDNPYRDVISERLATPGEVHVALVAESEGQLVGYAHLAESAPSSGQWFLDVMVPTTISDPQYVTESLLEAARQHCPDRSLSWWTQGPHAEVVAAIAARLGFSLSRRVLRLETPLSDDLAPDVDHRTFAAGDESAVAQINNAAFTDHPDRASWTAATVLAELRNPDDLILAPAGGPPRAFCWIKSREDGLGEIYVLASDPAVRGAGMGRRLMLDGLARLRRRGHDKAVLYVEHDNLAAIHLYESHGFVIVPGELMAYDVPPHHA